MARLLAWDVIAQLFQLSWQTVATAVRNAVQYGLENRETDTVRYLGIDEISYRKGHHYLTNVYDLEGGRLLWSGEGRCEETLRAFFTSWGKERTRQIQSICCDMWEPYATVVREACPYAELIFDKFHLIGQLLGEHPPFRPRR
jgi:transposase